MCGEILSSYSEIYNNMKDKYAELTGIVVDDVSDIGIRFAVLASEIYSLYCKCEWVKNQMFPNTAIGYSLDLHASQRDITRKNGTKSTGVLTFSTNAVATENINIPADTIVGTNGDDMVTFRTLQSATILTGQSSVNINAEAVNIGKNGNCPRGSINTIVTLVPLVDNVTNNSAFTGGTDVESDTELQKRIIDSFINASNGVNKAYYKNLCLAIDGVASVGVIPRNRGNGTVDIFLAGQNGTVSDQIVQQANNLLDTAREINSDVRAFPAYETQVEIPLIIKLKDNYNWQEVTQNCRQVLDDIIYSRALGEGLKISHIIREIGLVAGVSDVVFPSAFSFFDYNESQKLVAGEYYFYQVGDNDE